MTPCSKSMLSGSLEAVTTGTIVYVWKELLSSFPDEKPSAKPKTRSPAANNVTSGPTESTIPETSGRGIC